MMESKPLVSVVMSVYNDQSRVSKTINSILEQTYENFELIIINDGSTDSTQDILETFARTDPRIHIIAQANQGLTRSLITGCQYAQGFFIARQDSGDISLPQRLETQVQTLLSHPQLALVSTYTKFITSDGYELKEGSPACLYFPKDNSPDGFLEFLMPTHHGNTLFYRHLYNQVGGYRSQFYFAQDCDLWSRLNEFGGHQIIPETLYVAEFNSNSISGTNSLEQQKLRQLIDQATTARRLGQSEEPFIKAASVIKPSTNRSALRERIRLAQSYYFIGSCLMQNSNPKALFYFCQCIQFYPLHWRGWIKILLLSLSRLLNFKLRV